MRFGSAAAAARGMGVDLASAPAAAAASAPATASVWRAHARTRSVVQRLPLATLTARPGCGLRFSNRRRSCRPDRRGLRRARCHQRTRRGLQRCGLCR
jgi:hypothetical protein